MGDEYAPLAYGKCQLRLVLNEQVHMFAFTFFKISAMIAHCS